MRTSSIPPTLLSLLLISYSASTPFPKTIGVFEAMVALLAIALFILGIPKAKNNILSLSLISCLLFTGLMTALLNGNAVNSIIRDVIPILYFSFPFATLALFSKCIEKDQSHLETVVNATIALGFIYSLRECIVFFNSGSTSFFKTESYMLQAPCVLFTLILSNFRAITAHSNTRRIIYLTISAVCTIPLYYSTLRAPIALGYIAPLALTARAHPKIAIPALAIGATLFAEQLLHSEGILENFIKKQQTYGSNNKLAELQHVIESTTKSSLLDALLGGGWGTTWFSPAVGMEVNYAHSIITFGGLKLGITGMIISATYMAYLLNRYAAACIVYFRSGRNVGAFAISTAAISSILVGGLLESAYKTLDFGIITLLLFLTLEKNKDREPSPK